MSAGQEKKEDLVARKEPGEGKQPQSGRGEFNRDAAVA